MTNYRRATIEDIDILTELRVTVLLAANCLPENTDMANVKAATFDYYRRALTDGSHTAYIAYDNDTIAGTGAVSYYEVMPTYMNPSGKKAYIMNMYTAPQYRHQGIASDILRLLIQDARARGVDAISLEATAAGRKLYERNGFAPMEHEMELRA